MLLGIEFMRVAKGAYDSYTEMFHYRLEDESGNLHSTGIAAPCHTTTRRVVAYAYFAGLISSEAEMQDVQGGFEDTILEEEDIIPEDEDYGYHTSPLQLAATQLSDLFLACEHETEVRMRKEVRSNYLLRKENAEVRLTSVAPLTLPSLLPTSKWLGGACKT